MENEIQSKATHRKKDRSPLIGIWELNQTTWKQICMVRIKLFGSTDASEEMAIELMKGIAMKYGSGEIKHNRLYATRNAELEKLGLSPASKKNVKKVGHD